MYPIGGWSLAVGDFPSSVSVGVVVLSFGLGLLSLAYREGVVIG